MFSHDIGISPDAITIDCVDCREIEPTLEELDQLSQDGIRVTTIPDEIGGPIPPDVIIWVAENLFLSISTDFIVEALKSKLSQILQLLKEKLKKQPPMDTPPTFHIAFNGTRGKFSLEILENLNSEEMNKLYILFVEMAKLLSKK